ncbi:MAG: hypothetical protein Q8L56_10295 [Rhodocyclaceae bacterium]|nr:hypothetical protein [Rhodocyclaceae bacterium]
MQLPVTLSVRRFWFSQFRRGIETLTLRADGRIRIGHADGTSAEADVHPQSTVFSWLVVLLFRIDGRLESLVLPRGAMDAAAHRRLRVWLKWKATAAAV